jgi:hypothetical protein
MNVSLFIDLPLARNDGFKGGASAKSMCDAGFGPDGYRDAPGFSAACITHACAAGGTAVFQLRVGEKNFYATLNRRASP